jgi:hypothetical protein
MGPTFDMAPLLRGTQFHLYVGFTRASSVDYGIIPGSHAVTSNDGNTTYPLIVCANTRHTWIFCQASKSPPIFIIKRFLSLHGLKTGPRFLCMNQGGKLWRFNQLWEVAASAGYAMEPTGSDAASKKDKLERPNGTFDTMVRCLLYSANLSAIFWSDAVFQMVYLKNRLYHKASRQTPYEAWTGKKPPLAHLHTFGTLVMARKPEKQPANAYRDTAHGVLLGYGATINHVRYFDQTTNDEKLSMHHLIDDAHYSKTQRPRGPQILVDMRYEQQPLIRVIITLPPLSRYPLRSLHRPVIPFYSKLHPLPMNEFMSAPVAIFAFITAPDIDVTTVSRSLLA